MKKNVLGFKKVVSLFMLLALTVSLLTACAPKAENQPAATDDTAATTDTAATDDAAATTDTAPAEGGGQYIGISMPTQSSERWIKDGAAMKEVLEGKGYTVDLQYAEDDIPTQKSQIENMITKGAKVLVIAAVDGSTLSDTLDAAATKGVKVISYDRLLVNTDRKSVV